MLDGGVQIEPQRSAVVAAMRTTSRAEWRAADLALLKEGMEATTAGIPLKRLFGSDFPYRGAEGALGIAASGIGVKASLARGGLSNVWGAAMLPYLDADIPDWPIDVGCLDEHYRAVTEITGMSAASDDLADTFPLHMDRPDLLAPSSQAEWLLARLHAHRERLERAGLSFGRSRLAVAGVRPGAWSGCVRCGLCMYGCPYGFIYNSADTVDRLLEHPRFSYQPDFIVESLAERGASVLITGRDRLTGTVSRIVAERAYLAAGAIPTTRILLTSMAALDRPVRMLDSQYYVVPLLMLRTVRGVRDEPLHTLSQLYVEVRDPRVSPYTVHLQVYTYNDLIGQMVRRVLGPFAGSLDRLARNLEGRLIVLQGYLHSAHSGTMRVELRSNGGGREPSLAVTGEPRRHTRRVVRRVLMKLARHSLQLGAVPLLPLATIAEPGRGFHTGGAFPMRSRPGAFQTDVLGRPSGWSRVHVVDATVLPSIPATTITFTVMANAHRIGWESGEL